jgi:hypothetical protein
LSLAAVIFLVRLLDDHKNSNDNIIFAAVFECSNYEYYYTLTWNALEIIYITGLRRRWTLLYAFLAVSDELYDRKINQLVGIACSIQERSGYELRSES